MRKFLLIASLLLNLFSLVPLNAATGSPSHQSILRLPTSEASCSKIFVTIPYQAQGLLSAEDAETIKTYIFQGPIINFYLRNIGNPANAVVAKALLETNNLDEVKVQTILHNLDRVLAQQGLAKAKQVVYRGEGRPNDGSIHVGARLHYDNYISTTRDKSLAMGYANGNASGLKVLYEITVDRGQPGAQINLLAPEGVRNQDEFLLARNGTLIINEINTIDGVTYVKAVYDFNSEN